MRGTLIEYINTQYMWSKMTFGEGPRVEAICKHIEKELSEVRANPTDLIEWVDVIILALDGAWRSGYSAEEIVAALQFKQDENLRRRWPLQSAQDVPTEHIEEESVSSIGGNPKPMYTTYEVDVIKFVRPNGFTVLLKIGLNIGTKPLYKDMARHGCHFEAEVLRTGEVHVTITNDEEDVDCVVLPDGANVHESMEQMLRNRNWLHSRTAS